MSVAYDILPKMKQVWLVDEAVVIMIGTCKKANGWGIRFGLLTNNSCKGFMCSLPAGLDG
jgi:hypothetical protein